jgi:hypothetical protein
MPTGSKGQRKKSREDVEVERKIIYAAAQAIIRAILDALTWWITGGRWR